MERPFSTVPQSTHLATSERESMEGFRKGSWSKEEDAILLDWVAVHGPYNWSSIQSEGVLLRAGKSCRLRWVNKLRPGLKKGRKFSPEEEEMVVKLQADFGNKWAHIAGFFPGRTDNDVKNLWSTRKKRLARSPLQLKPGNATDNEVQIYETPTDDLQEDMAITSNRQETISQNYVNQCLNATSETPVLTAPNNNPANRKSGPLSAAFDNVMPQHQCQNAKSAIPVMTEPSLEFFDSVMPHQKCLNAISAIPVLTEPSSADFDNVMPDQQCLKATSTTHVTEPTSEPFYNAVPNQPCLKTTSEKPAFSESSLAPFDNLMPDQQGLNTTSATSVMTEPLSVPSDSVVPQQQCLNATSATQVMTEFWPADFEDAMPLIQPPSCDCLFGNESIFFEPEYCFMGYSGIRFAPPTFDDLTPDVLEAFERPDSPGGKV